MVDLFIEKLKLELKYKKINNKYDELYYKGLEELLKTLKSIDSKSGCEDCDYLEIEKSIMDLDALVCYLVDPLERWNIIGYLQHDVIDDIDITHIEPPDWCPGG